MVTFHPFLSFFGKGDFVPRVEPLRQHSVKLLTNPTSITKIGRDNANNL